MLVPDPDCSLNGPGRVHGGLGPTPMNTDGIQFFKLTNTIFHLIKKSTQVLA